MQITAPISIVFTSIVLVVATSTLFAQGSSAEPAKSAKLAKLAKPAKIDFVKQVLPILQRRCFDCHGPEEQEADLRFDKKAGLFVADKEDWVVLPGNVEDSEFYVRISLPADDDDFMPSEGDPLAKAEIETLRQWIEQGADWPDGADDLIAKQLLASAPKIEKLDLPALTVAQKAAEEQAIEALQKAGGLAMRVAANTTGSEVNLSLMGKKATNELVQLTADLSGTLVRLNLARTGVDDGGLAPIAKHGQLRWLNLSNTKVTDAGLEHLSGLSRLRYLNLYGTAVTDAGLAKLTTLKSLKKLFLWQSRATLQGAAKLEKTLPGLMVDMGEYAAALGTGKPPAESPAEAAVAINKKCPVTGRKVKAKKIVVYQGQAVGLCCDKCLAKFAENPAACIGKVAEFKVANGEVAVNKQCPVANKPVKAGKITGFRGEVIGFCCGNCKAKFEQNPAKYLGKLAVFKPKKVAVNKKCPVSGKALSGNADVASVQSTYQGRVIGLCCKKCKAKFDKNPKKFFAKLEGVFEK